MSSPNPVSSFSLTARLGALIVLSLLVVGFIYWTTLSKLENSPTAQLQDALPKVLPGATRFQRLAYLEGTLKPDPRAEKDADIIYAGYNAAGRFVGYAIPTEGPGYKDTIYLLYGYQPAERKVTGMEPLASRETPGGGYRIHTDQDFKAGFRNVAVDPTVSVVAKGHKNAPNQVDGLTGATISSYSVVSIINNANRRWLGRLPAPGTEPPAP